MLIRMAVQSRARRVGRPAGGSGGGSAPAPSVAIDPTYCDAELRQLRDLGFRGDWPAMAEILAPLRARGDYDRLTFLIGALDDVPVERIVPLAMNHADDPLVRTVVGGRQVAYA